MASSRVIKSFEGLPEELYVRQPAIGRMPAAARKLTTPNSLEEFYELLERESCDQKLYDDKRLTTEIVLGFPEIDSAGRRPALPLSAANIATCREHFLSHMIPELHYVNSDRLSELYDDTFREGVVKKLLLEIKNQSNLEIDSNIITVVDFFLSDKEKLKWAADTTLPQISRQQMLKRYIEYGISTDRIALGLETLDQTLLDTAALEQYEQEVDQARNRFTLIERHVERNRIAARKRAAFRIIDRLRNAGQWVLINAEFLIEKTSSGGFCFEFLHPVSDYLGSRVRILVLEVPEAEFSTGFSRQYSRLAGNSKSMNVFGHVFQPLTDNEPYEYIIKPYAIF
ncbi:hypothetical protein [uncultured Thiodictyon sp.]|uniref:hypothetical protein n=1 Tax=uncultured Thiodictyon sp. TaxID=1846217 RepID=UPI0025FE0FF7|nr:hypothetical protein [uncultured Thiodictyon sp.]